MNSRELTYTDDTSAYLVAGRWFAGSFSDRGFAEFCGQVDQLAGELDQPLVVLPAGNFSGTGVDISGGRLSCAIGVLIGHTDTEHIASLAFEDLTAAVASAEALPWDKIDELVSAGEQDRPNTFYGGTGLYATATGPLAGVRVGFGVLVDLRRDVDENDDEEDEDDEWLDEDELFFDETTGAAAVVPGLDLVQGHLEDQSPQPDAVYGVPVVRAHYDAQLPIALDISAAAHADRVSRLAELAAQSAYRLIASYD